MQMVVFGLVFGVFGLLGARGNLPTPKVREFPSLIAWESSYGAWYRRPRVEKDPQVAVIGAGKTSEVEIEAQIEIPDEGEVLWPFEFSSRGYEDVLDLEVENVEVSLRGLVHPEPGDLEIDLLHESRECALVRGVSRTLKEIGIPVEVPASVETGGVVSDALSGGVGSDLVFSSLDVRDGSVNLALGKSARQSSTLSGGVASRAVDGDASGSFGDATVAHTDGRNRVDPQPWWEVDLGTEVNVTEVKLWPRRADVDRDEVQVVQVTADAYVTGGSFRLRATVGGTVYETADISFLAVGSRSEEVAGATVAGGGPGESMESRIEAVGKWGNVEVRKETRGRYGSPRWIVVFESFPGNFPEMTVAAAAARSTGSVSVGVQTLTDGTSSTLVSSSGAQRTVDGLLAGATVFLLEDGPLGDVGFEEAVARASVQRVIVEVRDEAEVTLHFRVPVLARAVRVQMPDATPLALAEVAVFDTVLESASSFSRGGRLRRAVLASEQSLQPCFRHTSPFGTWILRLRDTTPASLLSNRLVHGKGSFSSFSLLVHVSNGSILSIPMDLTFHILHLPNHASLSLLSNASVLPDASTAILRARCRLQDCSDALGIGPPLQFPDLGPQPLLPNARFAFQDTFKLQLTPDPRFKGTDKITLKACARDTCSPQTTLFFSVRDCRSPADGCQADAAPDIAQSLLEFQ